jgi:hypothetical protein
MALQRDAGGGNLVDVLDRILDKGVVIDAWLCVSLVGVELVTVDARIVVASIETYLHHSEALGASPQASRPAPFATHNLVRSRISDGPRS